MVHLPNRHRAATNDAIKHAKYNEASIDFWRQQQIILVDACMHCLFRVSWNKAVL